MTAARAVAAAKTVAGDDVAGLRIAPGDAHPLDISTTLPRAYRDALDQVLAEPTLHENLAKDWTTPRPASSEIDDHAPDQTQTATPATDTPIRIASPHAGLALILPLVGSHLPPQAQIPSTLRDVAQHVLADITDKHDPTFDALFPVPPDAASPLPLPVPPALADTHLAGAAMRQGVAGWADVLLARFAQGLSGLQSSSRQYLRKQFLNRPGVIELTAERIHVTISEVPLAIVLQMGGMTGERGPIPHLDDRALVIEVANTL